jgi:hypothetical protein
MPFFQAYIKEASLHPSQVLVKAGTSKSYNALPASNATKVEAAENSLEPDTSNSRCPFF